MTELIAQVLPEGLRDMDLAIYDEPDLSEPSLLFDTNALTHDARQSAVRSVEQLAYGGRRWTLTLYALPSLSLIHI